MNILNISVNISVNLMLQNEVFTRAVFRGNLKNGRRN